MVTIDFVARVVAQTSGLRVHIPKAKFLSMFSENMIEEESFYPAKSGYFDKLSLYNVNTGASFDLELVQATCEGRINRPAITIPSKAVKEHNVVRGDMLRVVGEWVRI